MTARQTTVRSAEPSAPILLREERDGIAVLTFNQPETRNSLSEAMLAALTERLAVIADDHAIHAVVLAANGPAFSAGHDLKELTRRRSDADGGRAYTRYIMETCSAMMLSIVRLPQPVIAAVEGVAAAAGCQLVATCDLAVAGAGARFSTPGVQIGLFCSTPMVALSRNVARKHAMEMLLTGETIGAENALNIGLVNRVVKAGAARGEAIRLARKIAAKSAAVVRIGKQAFYRQLEMGIAKAYAATTDVMVENMMVRDAEEGIGAFIEKRDPRWEDR
jgi:enoyl-CoA hydratase/carnithine racemase